MQRIPTYEEAFKQIPNMKDADNDLSEIAKKFKSTMEEIATVNNIEDVDKLNIGDQLYIPKYACTKIS